jgi:hypothetical protein
MTKRSWRNTRNSRGGFTAFRDASSLDEAVRVSKKISWRVRYERHLASTAAREAHLRSLMGLPAVRSALFDDESGK